MLAPRSLAVAAVVLWMDAAAAIDAGRWQEHVAVDRLTDKRRSDFLLPANWVSDNAVVEDVGLQVGCGTAGWPVVGLSLAPAAGFSKPLIGYRFDKGAATQAMANAGPSYVLLPAAIFDAMAGKAKLFIRVSEGGTVVEAEFILEGAGAVRDKIKRSCG
jgi:hypothetical protein